MYLPEIYKDSKVLLLGTALWGWGIDKKTAFDILDKFQLSGGSIVDTAINYPINKNTDDFGLAIRWLSEWVRTNDGNNIKILVKIGAIDNMNSASSALRSWDINNKLFELQEDLGDSLSAISIHWDNRGETDGDEVLIAETVTALERIYESGYSVGLSGIKRPDIYLKSSAFMADKWWVQVKENILTSSDRVRYNNYFPEANYLAYGVNMGGLKLVNNSGESSLSLRGIIYDAELVGVVSRYIDECARIVPKPRNINELSLLISFYNTALSGIIVGPRTVEQLDDTVWWWNEIKVNSTPDMNANIPVFKYR